MPAVKMFHTLDPRDDLKKRVGDISSIEIFANQLLVAVYLRPEKTGGGIILTAATRDEDRYQGKVGLVIKKGPMAFVDEENKWFGGATVDVGDWIVFRPSDGWQMTLNNTDKVLCRVIDDVHVRARIAHPDQIW